jgi:hypothetical protein
VPPFAHRSAALRQAGAVWYTERMRTRRGAMVIAALAATSCDREAPARDVAPAFTLPTQASPVSPVCQAARAYFGAYATCSETPLPDLDTAAGSLIRVGNASDPSWRHVYVLVKRSGELAVGLGPEIFDVIVPALDLSATPADLLARLAAEVYVEAAIVRCLPGRGDVLPSAPRPDIPCTAPSFTVDGDHARLTFITERYSDPAGAMRDAHELWHETIEFVGGKVRQGGGRGLWRLDADARRPSSLPPLPGMTRPPVYAGAPVAARRSVSDALCRTVRAELPELAAFRCEAYAYPSQKLPTGDLFFLSNDAGVQGLMALRKPDGTIVVGDVLTSGNPLLPIVRGRDPSAVPPEQFLTARFLLHGTPVRVRCLRGETIPGVSCHAPSARFEGDRLVIDAVVEYLPLANRYGRAYEPKIRSGEWVFSPDGFTEIRGGRDLELVSPSSSGGR